MSELDNRKLQIFLKNKFVFKGKYVSKDSDFITIIDEKTGNPRMISISEISEVEVLR